MPTASDETSEVRWARLDELDNYETDPSMGIRVAHVAERRAAPYLG